MGFKTYITNFVYAYIYKAKTWSTPLTGLVVWQMKLS